MRARWEPWTAEENQYMLDYYGRLPTRAIAKQLGRKREEIWYRAQKMRLTKDKAAITRQNRASQKICPGDRVKVALPATIKDRISVIRTGRVLKIYERFILIEFDAGWRECINTAAIVAGEASVAKI